MKKSFLLLIFILALSLIITGAALAAPGGNGVGNGSACTTLQSGDLTYAASHYLAGQPLQTGYDAYGYNYQAHMFKGSYANAYLGGLGYPPYQGDDAAYLADNAGAADTWVWPYRDVQLTIQWNDAWISNVDCDDDGALDRHYGYSSYIGSGAWETNHMKGSYDDGAGKSCKWVYYTKIGAVPSDATQSGGVWYSADGAEIGPDIWGEFATIQEVENDPCAGTNGVQYISPHHPGFGGW